jgi:alkyl hydroperoxide reductase subunit AhpF
MALVVVETLFDRIAGEIARGRLESAGIDAMLFDGGIASVIGGGVSGVRLMVDEADVVSARALLADEGGAPA